MAASLSRSARGLIACVSSLSFVLACSLQDFSKFSSAEGVGGSSGSAGVGGTNEAGSDITPEPDAGPTAGTGGDAGSGGGGAGSGGGGTGGQGGTEDPGPINLFENPSFEQGASPWTAFGTSSLLVVADNPRSGTSALSSYNRTDTYMGPSVEISDLVEPEASYTVGAYIRVDEGVQPTALALKTDCVGFVMPLAAPFSPSGGAFPEWTYLEGTFQAPNVDCELIELRIYIEGPAAGVTFYIDDVSMYRND